MISTAELADLINDALPQTQCTRCGYPDCSAYARAIADGEAGINRCPPGGQQGIARLAAITGHPIAALNPANGVEGPRRLALIDEAWCIGCTLCIKACPVDCIVGGPKLMHTVISDACTGCDLCLPVCPVDCIAMVTVTGEDTGWAAWSAAQASDSRERYGFQRLRIERDKAELNARLAGKKKAEPGTSDPAEPDKKHAVIEAALARARSNSPR